MSESTRTWVGLLFDSAAVGMTVGDGGRHAGGVGTERSCQIALSGRRCPEQSDLYSFEQASQSNSFLIPHVRAVKGPTTLLPSLTPGRLGPRPRFRFDSKGLLDLSI